MKMWLAFLAFILAPHIGNAQELGYRIGTFSGKWGMAVDGFFTFKETKLHADVGIYQGGVGVEALLDLIYQPLTIAQFDYYLGLGPSLFIGNPMELGVAGEVGLGYRLKKYPIIIAADWRPTFWIFGTTQLKADSFGVNVRWNFGDKTQTESQEN